MNIEAFLEERADGVLRDSPAGDYVADIMEVALGDTINSTDTSDALLARIKALPDQAVAGRVLYRVVPEGLMPWQSWTQLTDTASNSPEAKRRMFALKVVIVVLGLLTLGFGGILLYEYAVRAATPSLEQYMIVFGPLTIVCLLMLGLRPEAIKAFVTAFTGRRG